MLVIGCGLVLGGAFVASRLLLSDVPVPPAPPTTTTTPVVVTPAPVDPPMNAVVLPPALARQREPGMVLPAIRPPEATAQPGATPTPAEPVVPADVAESPFQGRSEELDYAEGILGEATPSRERLVSAFEVFKRCVEQEAASQRCHRGLVLARSRLGLTSDQSVAGKTGIEGEKKPGQPSERAEELNRMRPPAQLK